MLTHTEHCIFTNTKCNYYKYKKGYLAKHHKTVPKVETINKSR